MKHAGALDAGRRAVAHHIGLANIFAPMQKLTDDLKQPQYAAMDGRKSEMTFPEFGIVAARRILIWPTR